MSRTSWRSYSLSVLCASLLAACSSGGGGSAQAPSTARQISNSEPIHLGSTSYQDSRMLNTNSNVNVTNDTNLTLKVFDTNNPQVQANTQAAISAAKAGNSKWYLSLDNVQPEDVKAVIFPDNNTGTFGSGLASVFLNNQVLSTPSNSSSFIDLASDSLNTAGITLDGRGVNVAIIDGYAKTTVSGFNKKPASLEYDAPEYLYSIHPEFNKESKPIPYLAEDGSHGTYVGLVIAGKRNLSGIAPNANLASAPIRQFDYEIGKVMERVVGHDFANNITELGNKAHIINNSYAIPDSEDYTKQTSGNPRDTYHSIYMAMDKIIKAGNAPLFVYATGNTNYQKYLENYVLKKNEDGTTVTKDPSKTEPQKELLRDLTEQDKKDFYDVKFGFKLDGTTALAHLLEDQNLADHMLTVSGYYLDISGVQYYIDQTIKDFLLAGKLNYTTTELFAEARKRLQEANLGVRAGIQDEMFIPYPNAIHCGVTKWHCITGDYTFYYPYEANESSPDYVANDSQRITTGVNGNKVLRLTGTSFAAPQVSAIAALVKQQFPWMTATQLKQTLLTTARDVGDPGVDEVFGWGIVNAAAAVNGPALFYAGDFDAQLNHGTTVPRNYYFNNSIYGNGGLHVSGTRGDYLYLTGTNQFTGQLLVKSGNVVVANRGLITGFNKDYEVTPQVAAPIAVNSEGRFYAVNAQLLSDLTVNGGASLRNTTIGGNLTVNPGATLQLDLGQRGLITVQQKAQLLGNLQIIRTQDYVPTTTTGSNRATVLVSANSLTANLSNYSIDNSALVNSNIYVKGNQLVIDIIADRPSTVSSGLAIARLQHGDAGIAVAGSQLLDGVFAVADAVASAGATPSNLNYTSGAAMPSNAAHSSSDANTSSLLNGELGVALPSYTNSAELALTTAGSNLTLSGETNATQNSETIDNSKFTAHNLSAAQLAALEASVAQEAQEQATSIPSATPASVTTSTETQPTGITLTGSVSTTYAGLDSLVYDRTTHETITTPFFSSASLESYWNTGLGIYENPSDTDLTLNYPVLTRYMVDDPTMIDDDKEFQGNVPENEEFDGREEESERDAMLIDKNLVDFDFNHDPTSVKPLDPDPSTRPSLPSIPQDLPPVQITPTPPANNNSLVTVEGDKKPTGDASNTGNSNAGKQPGAVIIDPTMPPALPSLPEAETGSTDLTLGNTSTGNTEMNPSRPSNGHDDVGLTTDSSDTVANDNTTVTQPSNPNTTSKPSNPATSELLATAQAIQALQSKEFLALSYSSLGNAYAGVTQLTQQQELSSSANWFNWGMSQLLQARPSTTAYYQGTNLRNQFTQAGTQVQGESYGYRQDAGVLMSNAEWSLGVMLGHSDLTYSEDAQIASGFNFTSKVKSYNLGVQTGYLLRHSPSTTYFLGADFGAAYRTYDSQRNLGTLGHTNASHHDWGVSGALGAGYNYAPHQDLSFTGAAHLGAIFNSGAEFAETGDSATSRFLGLSFRNESNTTGYLQLSQQLTYKLSRSNDWWGQHIPSWKLRDNMARFELEAGAELSLRLNQLDPSWTAQLGPELTQLRSEVAADTAGLNATANTTVSLGDTNQAQQVRAVFNQRGYWQLHTGAKLNLTNNLSLRVAYKHQHASTYRQNEVSLLLSVKIN